MPLPSFALLRTAGSKALPDLSKGRSALGISMVAVTARNESESDANPAPSEAICPQGTFMALLVSTGMSIGANRTPSWTGFWFVSQIARDVLPPNAIVPPHLNDHAERIVLSMPMRLLSCQLRCPQPRHATHSMRPRKGMPTVRARISCIRFVRNFFAECCDASRPRCVFKYCKALDMPCVFLICDTSRPLYWGRRKQTDRAPHKTPCGA